MRIQVNLASRPFVELRPFFLRLRLIMGALAAVGLALAIAAHLLSVRAEKQQAELDQLRNQTISVQQSRLHVEQRMHNPVNARVLDRAHFLNTLFLRKSFSWTAVMMDLENVLPNGVQVTSIEPQVAADGNVGIRLRVAGERANAVQLVRNLERSSRFLQPRLVGETSQLKENSNGQRQIANATPGVPQPPPGVEFDILADYNPLPPNQPYTVGHGRPAGSNTSHSGAIPVPTGASATGTAEAPAGTAQAASGAAAARSRSTGNSPAANRRRGYPAYGVTLPARPTP